MKKFLTEPKWLFTLLIAAAILAIAAGVYLGLTLGMQGSAAMTLLCGLGLLLWTLAWGEFLAMCLMLRKGGTAFTPATGQTLTIIGWCMVGLAAVTALSAYLGGTRAAGFLLIEMVLLPGLFLAVGVAAKVLHSLLTHAMSLEKEQEGVV